MTMHEAVIHRLLEGNRRFAAGHPASDRSLARRKQVAQGQKPAAEVLACVDSRVPPELVFDQGLGDLFVVRSAGLVLDKAVLGSLEFGIAELHIPLVIVLGHKRCGAVKATIETLEGHAQVEGEIAYLVEELKPAVEEAQRAGGDLWNAAARAQARNVVDQLRRAPVLGAAVQAGALKIVAGWYDLDSGVVELEDT